MWKEVVKELPLKQMLMRSQCGQHDVRYDYAIACVAVSVL
jgi:hypothetical protein